MIEVSKLHKMLDLESETAAAFKDLNPKEQQAYIKAHPASKYARGGKSASKSATGHPLETTSADRASAKAIGEHLINKHGATIHMASKPGDKNAVHLMPAANKKGLHDDLVKHGWRKGEGGDYFSPSGHQLGMSSRQNGLIGLHRYYSSDNKRLYKAAGNRR
jgi:hypothetical protein